MLTSRYSGSLKIYEFINIGHWIQYFLRDITSLHYLMHKWLFLIWIHLQAGIPHLEVIAYKHKLTIQLLFSILKIEKWI